MLQICYCHSVCFIDSVRLLIATAVYTLLVNGLPTYATALSECSTKRRIACKYSVCCMYTVVLSVCLSHVRTVLQLLRSIQLILVLSL